MPVPADTPSNPPGSFHVLTMPSPPPPSVLSRLPWWLVILGTLGFLLALLGLWDEQYRAIFVVVGRGLFVTVRVTVIAFAAALLLGTAIALGLVSRLRWLAEAIRAYVEVMRGVPMIVLLYYIAFAIGPALIDFYSAAFGGAVAAGLLPAITIRDFSFEWRAIFALTLAYSAFIAEIVRGGILSVPIGQWEAAQALGLSRFKTLSLVVLPQAFKTMTPPLGNDLVSMLKDSSLVSVLGIADITQNGKTFTASTFLFFQTYTVVAFLYLVMTIGLTLLVRRLESRMRRNEKI
ncbi:amino acid ABC transporter permease [Labrys monachus]|uniref:Polar amino acid transport system permease protein n=1 Tax=Labrys monachus TaxID=217067 RepID=A0ABU0FK03_9HYPH|nr:amino acid ABC transporter permease [Labrys monachus]MDQ0394943.1 polar amino acid transport system permease protein [Labrys monachus]